MRRVFLTVVLLCVCLSAFAQTELTIGMDFSMTGPAASLGIPNENAILLGPSHIAGLKVRYVLFDDRSDPTTAVQNVKRLITEDNIDLLLVASVTPTSLAVIDTVAQAKVPMISFGSIRQITSPVDAKRRWVFKTIANDDIYVESMLAHMLSKGVKTLSILAINDAYGESWVNSTKKLATEKGIKILNVERFERGDSSTVPQALRIVRENPDAVLISAAGTVAITPDHALKDLGYKGKIYFSGGASDADFLRVGGKTLEGAYVLGNPFIVADQLPKGYPTKQSALEFLKLYQAKYGTRSSYAAFSWDALKLVEAALPVALKSGAKPGTPAFREALRSALENSKKVVGVGAVYTMSPTDHVGMNALSVAVMRVKNSNWKLDRSAAF